MTPSHPLHVAGRLRHRLAAAGLLLALTAAGGCQNLAGTAANQYPADVNAASLGAEPPALYDALGERTGIARIVEDLLYVIVEDDRINDTFKGVDITQFHRNLTDQLCQISGGPCTYTGRTMRESHESLHITDTQFNALAEDLILAMEKNNVPVATQNRLLGRLVRLYPQIRGQ